MSEVVDSRNLVLWGWLLLTSGGLGIAFFVYRLIWLERFRQPDTTGTKPLMRIHGRVAGRPGTVVYCVGEAGQELIAQPFQVAGSKGQRWLVSPNGAVLAVRGYRHKNGRVRGLMAGDIVTIDGATTTLSSGDSLYRDAGRVQGVEAVRIAGGHWPELRWFRVPMAAAALVFVFSLGQILLAPGPTPLRTGLANAFKDLPGPTATVAGAGFSFSFRRCPPEPPSDLVTDEGIGVLIGDQLLGEIHLVEDHLITVQP
jgi:hypothetical protein